MKTLSIVTLALGAICASVYADYYTTVYTPNGTPIELIVTTWELSPSYLANLDYSATNNWTSPGATMIAGSTRHYNCHAYAWLFDTSDWLDYQTSYFTDNLANYWGDGSYTLRLEDASGNESLSASNASYLTSYASSLKIHYPDVDHTALWVYNTSSPGRGVSKWGMGPRMSHDLNYSPYTGSTLDYYSR
jgi:hypothetical protein